MMQPHDPNFDDSSLWRTFADATSPAGLPPSLEELARYLDGRLSESERDDLERRIADDPEALASLQAIRSGASDDALVLISPATLAAARDLVSARPEITVVRHRLTTWLQWTATAAAVVIVCGLAWRLGHSASVESDSPTSGLLADMSFGVLDGDSINDDDLLIILASDTGESPS